MSFVLRHILFGYIQETFDDTWLAHSLNYPVILDGIEFFGFANEFYAIRFLHQVRQAKYSDKLGEIPPLEEITRKHTYYPQLSFEDRPFSQKYLENYTLTVNEELSWGYDIKSG